MSVKNKTAYVTSCGAIGYAIALRLAQAGANVVVSDIDENRLKSVESELASYGGKILTVPCNIGKIDLIDNVFDKIEKEFGTLDILVNCAGIAGPTAPIFEIEPEQWDSTMEINLRSQYYCIKKAAPFMMKAGSGSIICLSSHTGKKPLYGRTPYCASKMAIIGLARTAALELGKYNIRVNTVCPGPVDSERIVHVWQMQAEQKGITYEEQREKAMEPMMLKHLVPTKDVAEAVLFFADDAMSNSITGQDLNVNVGVITY